MIVDRAQSKWIAGTADGALVSLALYVAYVVMSPNSPGFIIASGDPVSEAELRHGSMIAVGEMQMEFVAGLPS